MELDKAEALALKLMRKHHVYPTFHFGWTNGKRTCGHCDCYSTNKIIRLSRNFVINNSKKKVEEVIIHEISHAIDFQIRGYTQHDDFWKSVFIAMGGTGHTLVKDVK